MNNILSLRNSLESKLPPALVIALSMILFIPSVVLSLVAAIFDKGEVLRFVAHNND